MPLAACSSRALIAVVLGLVFALGVLRPAVDVPSVRTLLPELRAVAGVPCLVLARQVAEAHGGTLSLQNRTGHTGCIARLTIPT